MNQPLWITKDSFFITTLQIPYFIHSIQHFCRHMKRLWNLLEPRNLPESAKILETGAFTRLSYLKSDNFLWSIHATSHCEVTIKTDRNINYTWPSTTKHTQTLVCNNDDMHARRVSLMERVFFYLFLQIFAFNLAHIYCTLKKVNQKTNPCTARVKRMYNLSRGMASLTTLFILHNLITRPEISQTNSPGLWYKRGDSPHVPKSIVTSTWICKPLQENSFKKNRIN